MKRTLLASSLLLVCAAFAVSVFAGEIHPSLAAYLETIGDDDFASVIVHLKDRPNIRALDDAMRIQKLPLAARHERVITALRQAAERSQPAVLGYLAAKKQLGSVGGYTPYWISNMMVVYATKLEIQKMALRGDIESVEPNFKAALIASVGNAYLGSPTAGVGVTKSLKAINAHLVWRDLGYTGAGTLVANMDTGVEGTHPALTSRWRGNWHPWQECWRDAAGYGLTYPDDYDGHGTHTMGTMAGAGHSTGDTVGVAFDALWIADNSIDNYVGPEFDNDVLGGFQWFADPDGNAGTTDDRPDVVQNSWGIDARFGYDYRDCDYRWQEAIDNCEAAGVVVTFSAGNEGPYAQTNRSPANICNTPTVNFSVGAVDAEAYSWPYPIASFSSRGPSDCDGVTIKPEVSAPGVSVYSSYPGGGYTRMSGTSMAGPHVAGVVALMRQANPNADVQTIKTVLMATARDEGTAGEDNAYGWGCIDAYQAVLSVSEPDVTPPTVAVTAPNGGEVLNVNSVYRITWNATDDRGVAQVSVYYSYDGGANYNFITNIPGNPGYYDWTVPNTPSAQCLVRVYAFDAANNQGSDVSNAFFTIQVPQGPYVWVKSIDLTYTSKVAGSYVTAKVTVWDQNNQPVSGATVSSHWAGLTSDSDVFTTKRTGIGSCTSNKVKNPVGWWYYYVDNVVKSGYTFRSDLGETSDAIYVGGIEPSEPGLHGLVISQTSAGASGIATNISFSTAAESRVSLVVYDVAGHRVRTVADEFMPAGFKTFVWDGTNDGGDIVSSGVYFCRIVAGDHAATEKLMLVK